MPAEPGSLIDSTVLALKLFLVPTFLLLVSLASQRWGPKVAGWLAGLPVVAGPILAFIALEQGPAFAAAAAATAAAGLLASVSFSIVYARAAHTRAWPGALGLALLAWLIVAAPLSRLPPHPLLGLGMALATLLLAPRLFPPPRPLDAPIRLRPGEMGLRMAAGAALTLGVSGAAGALGSHWSGMLAVFPMLGSTLAVFSHRAQGGAYAATLLRAMVTGLYSLASFCVALALLLDSLALPLAFALATALCLAVQIATRKAGTSRR